MATVAKGCIEVGRQWGPQGEGAVAFYDHKQELGPESHGIRAAVLTVPYAGFVALRQALVVNCMAEAEILDELAGCGSFDVAPPAEGELGEVTAFRLYAATGRLQALDDPSYNTTIVAYTDLRDFPPEQRQSLIAQYSERA